MWKIKQMKKQAKQLLKSNYSPNVCAALIFSLLTYAAIGSIGYGGEQTRKSELFPSGFDFSAIDLAKPDFTMPDFPAFDCTWEEILPVLAIAGGILGIALLVALAIAFFVRNPIRVGYARFLMNCEGTAKTGDMFRALKGVYFSSGWKMLLTDLSISLWSLLLIVPGIIKAYSFRMVPYVLAEYPGLSSREARRRSAEMMKGHRWHSFAMDLSFIGWYFLSSITLGVLGFLYADPFIHLTECELYKALRH